MEREERIDLGNQKLRELFKWVNEETEQRRAQRENEGKLEKGLDANIDIDKEIKKEFFEKLELLNLEFSDVADYISMKNN